MSLIIRFKEYREKSLKGLWIDYSQIKELLLKLPSEIFKNEIIGHSENNIPIHKITAGNGSKKILLWSQMHGDESTGTKVLFDIFNYIKKESQINNSLKDLLQQCTLIFIPILNPDGALAYTRENANSIDLNRDAKDLKTVEGQLLHATVSEINPDFAFNLHDQDSFYNVSGTDKVATISVLSTAADKKVSLTRSRREAMSVISVFFESLQRYIPNQIGRYNDDFCDNCFGDSIQAMGVPTILIESGYYPGDSTREKTRKYHFIGLINALFAISENQLPNYKSYFTIPLNEKNYYDVRYDNIIYENIKTSVAVRYIYKIIDGNLKKIIKDDETINGISLKGKLFHKVIDAKGNNFSDIS